MTDTPDDEEDTTVGATLTTGMVNELSASIRATLAAHSATISRSYGSSLNDLIHMPRTTQREQQSDRTTAVAAVHDIMGLPGNSARVTEMRIPTLEGMDIYAYSSNGALTPEDINYQSTILMNDDFIQAYYEIFGISGLQRQTANRALTARTNQASPTKRLTAAEELRARHTQRKQAELPQAIQRKAKRLRDFMGEMIDARINIEWSVGVLKSKEVILGCDEWTVDICRCLLDTFIAREELLPDTHKIYVGMDVGFRMVARPSHVPTARTRKMRLR